MDTELTTGSTIAAISTPFGRGGVALIRISGPDAGKIAQKIFLPKKPPAGGVFPARRAVYGSILCDGAPIDDGLLTFFCGPASYTGEDCAEISCHGGALLSSKVLESALAAGAVPAEAGEFTKRAFLAGKISLTGAEAVIDLINAESEEQLALAGANSRGKLSQTLAELCRRLTSLLARIYVVIDYPDEDLTELSGEEFLAELTRIKEDIQALYDSYKTGHAVVEGVRTAIVGKPNVGKSSLLNLLLGRDRAIVSKIAGTTRDTIEESVLCGRVLLRLVDTAGLRETEDAIEKMGVERTLAALSSAELILALFDLSAPASEEDLDLIERLRGATAPVIALLNKSDLPPVFDRSLVSGFDCLTLSTLEKEPPKELFSRIERLFFVDRIRTSDGGILTNARQASAVRKALSALENALLALRAGEDVGTAALDVEDALAALGETDGRSVGEDIVSEIFSRFCVGK